MAASTDLTPFAFYTTGLSTSAAAIYTPTTDLRAIVTAVYVINRTTSDVAATIVHRMTSGGADIDLMSATVIEANKTSLFGPVVMTSTSSQQSIRGFGATANAIQVGGYGYTELI